MSARRTFPVVALILAGCFAHDPPSPTTDNAPIDLAAAQAEFALGPGDTFDVRVVGETELTGQYRVGPDGTIDFPYIGQLLIDGMLPHGLAEAIGKRLKEGYLRNPQVTVTIREQTSKKITIVGQVQKNGSYPYTRNLEIVEAIGNAGGFTAMAAKNDTTVTRVIEGKPQVIRVPVADISDGRAPGFQLRPGDRIAVPERIF